MAFPKPQFTSTEFEQMWLSRHQCVDQKVLARFPNEESLHTDTCNDCKLAGHRKCIDASGKRTLACLATGKMTAASRQLAAIKQPERRKRPSP